MIIFTTIGSFFITIQQTVFVLFIMNELKLTSLQFGLVVSCSEVASLIGALLVSRIARRIGPGPTIILGQGFTGLGGVLLAVAGGPPALALFLLVSGQISSGLGTPLYSVNQIALRQAMTPRHLLGRVNASRRFLVFGIMPLGALLNGLLGSALGLRPTLIVGSRGAADRISLGALLFHPSGTNISTRIRKRLTRPQVCAKGKCFRDLRPTSDNFVLVSDVSSASIILTFSGLKRSAVTGSVAQNQPEKISRPRRLPH